MLCGWPRQVPIARNTILVSDLSKKPCPPQLGNRVTGNTVLNHSVILKSSIVKTAAILDELSENTAFLNLRAGALKCAQNHFNMARFCTTSP
jgi:hypothetical protein